VINEVNKDSMEEDYKDEGSTKEDINKESNKSEGKIWIVWELGVVASLCRLPLTMIARVA
jgi:hypothetical protein